MKVTLYKGYPFSSDYKEVYFMDTSAGGTESPHTQKLATLEKIELDIAEIYLPKRGTLSINLEQGEFEYNYMSTQLGNNKKRFYFIEESQYINNCAVITYSEDIWANYILKAKFRYGVLSQSLSLTKAPNQYIKFANIPFTPKTTGVYEFSTPGGLPYNKQCYMIAQVQFYNLGTSGELTKRLSRTVLIKGSYGNGENQFSETPLFDNDNITDGNPKRYANLTVSNLGYLQNAGETTHNLPGFPNNTRVYFSINDIYYLPQSWNIFIDNIAPSIYTTASLIDGNNIDGPRWTYYFYDYTSMVRKGMKNNNKNQYDLIQVYTYIVGENYGIIKLGTFDNAIDYSYTHTDHTVNVYIYIDDTTFGIMMYIENGLKDVSSSFSAALPIDFASAESQQQNLANFQLKNISGAIKIATGIGNFAASAASSGATGVAKAATGSYIRSARYLAGEITNESAAITSAGNIAGSITDLIYNNKDLFSSNSDNFEESLAPINSLYGLVIYKAPEAQSNIELLRNHLALEGYSVNEVIDVTEYFEGLKVNLFPTVKFGAYDVVKFDYIELFGSFDITITNTLCAILTHGLKLYVE